MDHFGSVGTNNRSAAGAWSEIMLEPPIKITIAIEAKCFYRSQFFIMVIGSR